MKYIFFPLLRLFWVCVYYFSGICFCTFMLLKFLLWDFNWKKMTNTIKEDLAEPFSTETVSRFYYIENKKVMVKNDLKIYETSLDYLKNKSKITTITGPEQL